MRKLSELAIKISGGRVFQAEASARAKAMEEAGEESNRNENQIMWM